MPFQYDFPTVEDRTIYESQNAKAKILGRSDFRAGTHEYKRNVLNSVPFQYRISDKDRGLRENCEGKNIAYEANDQSQQIK